jgi:hypothetical protein
VKIKIIYQRKGIRMENLLGNLGNAFTNYKIGQNKNVAHPRSRGSWPEVSQTPDDFRDNYSLTAGGATINRDENLSEEEKERFRNMNMGEWKKHVGMPEDEGIFSDYRGMSQGEGEWTEDREYDQWYGDPDEDPNALTPEQLEAKFRQSDYYPGEGIMLDKYTSGGNPNPGGIGSIQKSFQMPGQGGPQSNFNNLWEAYNRSNGNKEY